MNNHHMKVARTKKLISHTEKLLEILDVGEKYHICNHSRNRGYFLV